MGKDETSINTVMIAIYEGVVDSKSRCAHQSTVKSGQYLIEKKKYHSKLKCPIRNIRLRYINNRKCHIISKTGQSYIDIDIIRVSNKERVDTFTEDLTQFENEQMRNELNCQGKPEQSKVNLKR